MKNLKKWLISANVAIPLLLVYGGTAMAIVPGSETNNSKISKNHAATVHKQPDRSFFNSPLAFEPYDNKGGSSYVSRGQGHTMLITPERMVLMLNQGSDMKRDVVQVNLSGANPHPKSRILEPLQSKSNYLVGNDPKQWRTNVPNYARLRYEQIYPGIDLEYYGNQQQLEYDFIVSPGANPELIRLNYTGVEQAEMDGQRNLIVHTAHGRLIKKAPIIYQIIDGNKKQIDGHYVLTKNLDSKTRAANYVVGFQVANYDKSIPLVIDPVISFSTYLGGSGNDTGYGIAVDGSGNVYVTGTTTGSFPTLGAYQSNFGLAFDAFIAKYNSIGTLLYATYLGGSGIDNGLSIAVDGSGNPYITGSTTSTNFPTASPYQATIADGTGNDSDAFVAKLNSFGTAPLYSTYLGGQFADEGRDIALDSSGNMYITGSTSSRHNNSPPFPLFPLGNALQPTYGGSGSDAFVTKIAAAGNTLTFSTYIGGSNIDDGNAIALDSSNNVYITGSTYWVTSDPQPLFPVTQGAAQTTHGGTGAQDVFVVKILADGSAKTYSTFLGGAGIDLGKDIAVDSGGNAYVTGSTRSTDFPVVAAYQGTHAGGTIDVFVTKVNSDGSAFSYSTFLGGGGEDEGEGIDVDGFGNVYITGYTGSTTFPVANPIAGISGVVTDAFVTKLDAAGTSLVYSTYIGGSGITDVAYDITVNTAGTAYITGTTNSDNFPVASAQQSAKGGSGNVPDAFITKITLQDPDLVITMTDSPDPVGIGVFLDYNITVTNNGFDAATGVVVVDTLPGAMSYVSSTPDQGSCTSSAQFVSCIIGTIAASAAVDIVIKVSTSGAGSFDNSVSVAANETDSNTANNTATVNTTAQVGGGTADPPGGGGGGSTKKGGGGVINLSGFMAMLLLLGLRLVSRGRRIK